MSAPPATMPEATGNRYSSQCFGVPLLPAVADHGAEEEEQAVEPVEDPGQADARRRGDPLLLLGKQAGENRQDDADEAADHDAPDLDRVHRAEPLRHRLGDTLPGLRGRRRELIRAQHRWHWAPACGRPAR